MKKLNKNTFSQIYPHLINIVVFVVVSLAVFYPLLLGKKILQSDSRQYQGMSRQLQDSRNESSKELYWIDNAYGGMPTYQLGAKYPYDILTPLHKIFRTLPAPAFLVFLYFLGAYLFFLSLRLPKEYAFLGALAYGLSTYLLIIIQVGHNTKAQALGYLPFVFAAVFQLMKSPRLIYLVLTTLALALQVRANHYQMTYYMLMLLAIYLIIELLEHKKRGDLSRFVKKIVFLFFAGIVALGLNATSLLATAEYTKFSTRGKSELTYTAEGLPKEQTSGLTYEYITQFSYGLFESFNLIIPRIQGGASREDLGESSQLYASLIQNGASPLQARQFVSNAPTYWGDQPILEAPAYVGVVVVFLGLLSLFLSFGPSKRWLLFGIIFSLSLSWGKNFDLLTRFFIEYFPLYNKFRAVSSIQVVLEFCFPVLAILGLNEFFKTPSNKAFKILKKSTVYFLGTLLVLYLLQGALSFRGPNDSYYLNVVGNDLMNDIVQARKDIYQTDLFRAFIFVSLTSFILYLYLKKKLAQQKAFITIAILLIFDLVQISNRYLDRDLFTHPGRIENIFSLTQADLSIMQDSTHYRVYEPSQGLQGARAAYHHNSIGGYHGAKPRRLEELFELFQIKKAENILNMLNIKYLIYEDENGALKPLRNPENYGVAWWVDSLLIQNNADAVYQKLTDIDLNSTALIEGEAPNLSTHYFKDSLSKIELIENKPHRKIYQVSNKRKGFIVFSEMYYPYGWSAYINDKNEKVYPANYVLRGLEIPAGSHEVRFEFTPIIIQHGGYIQLISIAILLLLLTFSVWENLQFKKQ